MRIAGWEGAERRETRFSTVLLGRDRVLKRRKPVVFGSLNFTRLQDREASCRGEAQRNRRTAPGVTLGVRRITASSDGLQVDGPGPVVDYAVEMRRLPDARQLLSLQQSGALTVHGIDRVAHWLARFHGSAPRRDRYGSTAAVRRLVEESLRETPGLDVLFGPAGVQAVREHQCGLIDRAQERLASGRVCDGHGGLRADHVYLLGRLDDPEVIAIDGVQLSTRYRCADVASDVALLAVDLTVCGAPGLSERLVARWVAETADWGAYDVVDRYMGARALGRARVRALLGETEASQVRLRLAHALAVAQRQGALVAVCGPIASGKSTLVERLATRRSLPVVSAGVAPEVCETLLMAAQPALRSGRTVLIDASFRSEAQRQLARAAAASAGVPCRFVCCTAPAAELAARLARRTGGVSDAGRLLEDFLRSYTAPTGDDVFTVDTSRVVDLAAIDAFVCGLAPTLP